MAAKSVRWRTDTRYKATNNFKSLFRDDHDDEEVGTLGSHLLLLLLATTGLTAFLVHIGAAEPWTGGVALPTTVWLAWFAVGIARAARHRARLRREAEESAQQVPGPSLR